MTYRMVGTDRLSMQICDAIGIDPKTVRRIVIDLPAARPGRLLFETFVDDDRLSAVFAESGIEIVAGEEPS